MARAGPSSRCSTRARISAAALLVNVTASTLLGGAPSASTSQAMRCTSTRVLPLPAPATTSKLPTGAVTASRWRSFRPSRMCVTSISARGSRCCWTGSQYRLRKPPIRPRLLWLAGAKCLRNYPLLHLTPQSARSPVHQEPPRQSACAGDDQCNRRDRLAVDREIDAAPDAQQRQGKPKYWPSFESLALACNAVPSSGLSHTKRRVSGSRKFRSKARPRRRTGRTSSGRNTAAGLPAATRRARAQASARFVAVTWSMPDTPSRRRLALGRLRTR